MANPEMLKKIIAHAKEYGFIFQSSEIYDGLSAVYDYGQNGVELKNNIKKYWWDSMVKLNENIVGIDTAIFMHPKITNKRVLDRQAKIDSITERFQNALNNDDLDDLKQLIIDEGIICPVSGSKNWTDVRQFNLMFDTKLG